MAWGLLTLLASILWKMLLMSRIESAAASVAFLHARENQSSCVTWAPGVERRADSAMRNARNVV